MQTSHLRHGDPQSAEEALVGLMMQASRRLRTRHPEDQVDPSCFPLAKVLMSVDGMRVSDLATKVELDTSTVSRQIKQFEDKGIVMRTSDPADGRASLVALTDLGRKQMQGAFQRRFDRLRLVLQPWSERDRRTLKDLLTRLTADLRAANDLDESRSH
ncbi:MAG: MarR family winged helix-turn-helix transcriptional regulator [Nocardioidaceae bacterium]